MGSILTFAPRRQLLVGGGRNCSIVCSETAANHAADRERGQGAIILATAVCDGVCCESSSEVVSNVSDISVKS